jgi:hypothetical protein
MCGAGFPASSATNKRVHPDEPIAATHLRAQTVTMGNLTLRCPRPGAKGTWNGADSNSLSMERTRLAYERTMMAGIRIGVSLISFGFSIFNFFQILEFGPNGAFWEGSSAHAASGRR